MVVPEQRHLFLERTLRVHHPEQPALARVFDAGIRRELPARGDPHVLAIAYLGIDLVRLKLVVEELRGQDRSREGGQPGQICARRAKRRPPEKMLNLRTASCHAV